MANFIQRYLSFEGRLARLPFISRNIFIGVLAAALFMASIPFFMQEGLWWWVGLLDVVVALAALPLAAIGAWVTFWPGSAATNRFGE